MIPLEIFTGKGVSLESLLKDTGTIKSLSIIIISSL